MCPTLWDPMGCSLPGYSAHGIFQARVLEWVAISFSRRSSRPRDWTQVSRIVGRHFTIWATREVLYTLIMCLFIIYIVLKCWGKHCFMSPNTVTMPGLNFTPLLSSYRYFPLQKVALDYSIHLTVQTIWIIKIFQLPGAFSFSTPFFSPHYLWCMYFGIVRGICIKKAFPYWIP